MSIELAQAYVSITAETSKMPGQIKAALGAGQAAADGAGRGMGAKLASGVGSVLKAGMATAGIAAGAVLATALSQGMGRLVAIDDAKGKLAGLGHDAEGVATIMDSALKSVKGTAYGLGDAATIAASAVAAGIKPGEDLTKYLSLTGDAATIAGTSLEEMGSIFNKVQTSGTAFTDNLNQLSDRGIPIFQWLQDEYGVTADELSDMVKKGEVDSATFKKVIEENIGGAALESGKTLRGSFENMKAALGRVGAGALEPFLPIMKNGLGKVTEFADKITPLVKSGAEKVAGGLFDMGRAFQSSGDDIDGAGNRMQRMGVRLREITDGVQGVWSILKDGDFKGAKMTFGLEEDSKAVDTLFRIRDGAQSLWAVLKSPDGEKFSAFMDVLRGSSVGAADGMDKAEGTASKLTGALKGVGSAVAGGGIAAISLLGDTAQVAATGIGVLSSVMGFLADHTTIATVAIGALAAAFVVSEAAQTAGNIARVATAIMTPASIASQRALTAALGQHTAALRADIVARGGQDVVAQKGLITRAREAVASNVRRAALVSETSALGAYAAAQRAAATNSGLLLGTMQRTSAQAALMAGGLSNLATAAGSKLKSGLSSALGMMGGPWGAGIIAATALVYAFSSAHKTLNRDSAAADKAVGDQARRFSEFGASLSDALGKSNGVADSGVKSIVSQQLSAIDADLDDAAGRLPSKWQKLTGAFETVFTFGKSGAMERATDLTRVGEAAASSAAALDKLNMSNSDATKAVTGTATEYRNFVTALQGTGQGAGMVVSKYAAVRQEFLESQQSASAVSAALEEINSGATSAAGGVDSLTGALRRLRDDNLTVEDAQAATTLALDAFKTSAAEAGTAAFTASGQIDQTTKAGASLHSQMLAVSDAFLQSGSAAYDSTLRTTGSVEEAAAAAEDAGQRIRDDFVRQRVEAGYSEEAANALADQYRLFPKEIPTAISLNTATAQTDADNFYKNNNNKKLSWFVQLANQIQDPTLNTRPANATPGGIPSPFGITQPRAEGGPIFGQGGPTSDSIPTLLSAGEHVITAAEVKAAGGHGAVYAMRAAMMGGPLRRATGGAIELDGITAALNAGRSVNGNKYEWGGSGPTNFDCSGFVGWLQQIAMGIVGSTKRLYTTLSLLGGATAGLEPGLGPEGTYFRVGVSDEHMAATIDGNKAESGGANGTSGIGPDRAGAEDSQFPDKFYLPNGLVAGLAAADRAASTRSSSTASKWTDDKQLDLDSATVAITQAEEDRDAVQAKVNDGKATQADLDQANIKVQKAQQKVVDLQAEKDDAANGVADGPAPQAPALARQYTQDEADKLDLQAAVEAANERRNEVYADPASTDTDIAKADAELSLAQQKVSSGASGSTSGSGAFSLKDRFKQFGTEVSGVFTDAVFAQMPFDLGSSRFWDLQIPEFGDTSGAGSTAAQAIGPVPAFSQDQVDSQLGFTPDGTGAVPEWVKGSPIAEALLRLRDGTPAPKVYDTGGWLKPGETAINLSSKPEPIFNSPEQLAKFAGGLNPMAEVAPAVQDYSIHVHDPVVDNFSEFKGRLNTFQRERALGYMRR